MPMTSASIGNWEEIGAVLSGELIDFHTAIGSVEAVAQRKHAHAVLCGF